MSLAASGGGAGMGGAGMGVAAMAHGGPSAMATHQATSSGGANNTGPPPGTSAAPPPVNAAALGADLLDKNQNLNLKQIRGVVDMPIVALDLFGGGGGEGGEEGDGIRMEVAMFSPKKKGEMGNASGIIQAKSLGNMSSNLYARKDDKDGLSHRALRRLLAKSKGYEAVFKDTLVDDSDGTSTTNGSSKSSPSRKGKNKQKNRSKSTDDDTSSSSNVVTIPSPHLLLGARLTKHLHPATASKFTLPTPTNSSTVSAIIDEEDSNVSKSIASIRNGNLDGSTSAQGNDYDRITLNLQLHSDKKTLSVLPEEAVSILTAQAKKLALQSSYDLALHSKPTNNNSTTNEEDDDEAYLEYPTAIAIPGWACQDNTIDALSDSCNGSTTPIVLYQRPIAALAGTLLPTEQQDGNQRKLVSPRLCQILEEMIKKNLAMKEEAAKKAAQAQKGSSCCGGHAAPPVAAGSVYVPTVVLAGLTADGIEYTAVQVGSPNNQSFGDGHCPLGEFRVLATVSYRHANPLSIAKKALGEFTDVVDEIYPELEDEGGIAAFVTYGTIASQLALKDSITKTLTSIRGEDGAPDVVWHASIPFSSTREEVVALGTAILAAISYGRIEGEEAEGDKDRMRPSIRVQNVAPCAVGVVYNFDGGREGTEWTDPKVVFDYDRRVPTSAHRIDFSASECVAIRKDRSLLKDEEKLFDEAQKWSKGKHNPLREDAALDLRVRVVQRMERGGEWRGVGNVFPALTQDKEVGEDDEDDKDSGADGEADGAKKSLAVETSTLELTLDSVGFIGVTMSSDGQSILQAVKTARNTSIWWYVRVFSAIVFFGGFFLKSLIDDRIRKHDVKRILAFYKQAAPGTMNDGDNHNAQYLCWKYKGTKDKLWRRLETKYGEPVKELHEYEAMADEEEDGEEKKEEEKSNDETNEDEEEDLDKDTSNGDL